MPEYLVTARNAQGKKVTERLDVNSADEAVQTLRERGYDDIVLHTDDVAARHTKQKAVASTVSPRQYLWFRSMPSWLAHVLVVTITAYRKGWYWNVAALALLAYRLWQGRGWGLTEIGLVIYLFFPVIFAFGSLLFRGASSRYRRLMDAVAWGKWDEVLRLADAAAGKLPAAELAFQKAKALAGLGRIDEGLRLVEHLGDGKKMPLSTYWSRVAGLYTTAKRRDDSKAAMEKSLESSPENATLLLDMAESEVWLRHNPKRARELLARAQSHAISDLLEPFVINTEGMIHLEEGRAREARQLLEQAFEKARVFRHASPLMEARLDRMHVPLVLACAAEGDLESAERHWRMAKPRLMALKMDDDLARCEKALGSLTASLPV
jgi:tetratricopeptide (TPR) repeat protein